MNNRSRSTLFLMEQLIVILVFAISAAACVKIFVDSHITASDSRDIRSSILLAESAAECYKFSGGDPIMTAELLGARTPGGPGPIVIYYDMSGQVVDIDKAFYVMELTSAAQDGLQSLQIGEITVARYGGELLFALSVAARGAGG